MKQRYVSGKKNPQSSSLLVAESLPDRGRSKSRRRIARTGRHTPHTPTHWHTLEYPWKWTGGIRMGGEERVIQGGERWKGSKMLNCEIEQNVTMDVNLSASVLYIHPMIALLIRILILFTLAKDTEVSAAISTVQLHFWGCKTSIHPLHWIFLLM